MQRLVTIDDMRLARAQMSGRVALVPTMGALHAGHMALVERARRVGHQVVVSIFVNPTQFGPHEDFEQYPRPLEDDLAACKDAGVDAVFTPTADQMYPPTETPAHLSVPALARDLEAAHRPGHFEGVCRVCCKLFNIVRPDAAVFGRKDYQQLRVIECLVADLNLPLRIEAVDTKREEDGLAISSRNRYLDAEQRPRAVGLFKALQQAGKMVEESGETDPEAVESAMAAVMIAHHVEVDYAVVRHPQTLRPVDCVDPSLSGGVTALVAGRLGPTRLLDNMLLGATAGRG